MLKRADVIIPQRLRGLSGWLAVSLVLLALLTGIATFLLLTGVTPIKPNEQIVRALLVANAVFVGLMVLLIAGQVCSFL